MAAESTYCLKLYEDPLIFAIVSGWGARSGLRACLAEAGTRLFHLLVVPYWNVEHHLDQFLQFAREVEALPNNIDLYYLCPTPSDVIVARSAGLQAMHIHQNAFIDENVFRPQADIVARFDAIHNAAMVPWKRHDLAWNIENLCLVTYRHAPSDTMAPIAGYKSLKYANVREDGNVDYLGNGTISILNCASGCGLILSRVEGANFASAEYQFCGIPVVSTPSSGGREYFFDEESTFIVPPQAELVEQAVREARERQFDPVPIHQRAVRKAIMYRERLLDWMSAVAGQQLHAQANANAWFPTFRDKLRQRVEAPVEAPVIRITAENG